MTEPDKPTATRGWDTYWQGTRDKDSYAKGGVSHPAVSAFWDQTLSEILATSSDTRILDIATGSGAVLEKLLGFASGTKPEITCVDISDAAIDGVHRRYPTVTGIVADARSIPLDSARFDLVTSQFGVEYAGPEALDEAARLLAPRGVLAILMHIRPGMIFNECRASLDAVRCTQRAEFVELSLQFFEAGFAAVRGADRTPYEKAGLALDPAIRKIEAVLADLGEDVAGGTITKLHADVERIHTHIQHYEPTEVIEWLQTMAVELDAYAERMASMCNAATDKQTFRTLIRRLEEQGLTIVHGKPLKPAGGFLPVAWILRAVRAD